MTGNGGNVLGVGLGGGVRSKLGAAFGEESRAVAAAMHTGAADDTAFAAETAVVGTEVAPSPPAVAAGTAVADTGVAASLPPPQAAKIISDTTATRITAGRPASFRLISIAIRRCAGYGKEVLLER